MKVALAQSITRNSSKQAYYTARMMVDRDKVDDFFRAYAYFRWADDVIDIHTQSQQERISFIAHEELACYTNRLGRSVTDGILHFVGNGCPYSPSKNRYQAATAAHISHLLRDTVRDTANGFINIPREYLATHGIRPDDFDSPPYRAWVRERVRHARKYFAEGKIYLGELEVLRAKIVGHWYCARFLAVLDTIERDEYLLRDTYNEGRRVSTWIRIGWLGISVTIRHFARRLALSFWS